MYAQAGVTIFKRLLQEEMKQVLDDHLPQRVLPITTQPPSDLAGVISAEFDDVKALLQPGARKRLEARAKLRTLAILETSIGGTRSYPTEAEMSGYERKIKIGADWKDLFPGIASLRLDTEGTGLTVSLKITKAEGEPIKVVSEGDPSSMVVAVRRVNELDYYSLTAKQMAKKLCITTPKFSKLGKYLRLKQDPDYYKEWKRNSSIFYGYSPKALDFCRATLTEQSIDDIWRLALPT
ncbi:MAG: hypothetical protein O9306_13335 [Beijerinckiaceae bacterium]|jgi:hypothetical protein|nr:hypothetical protein [Beijerinckiaceae bacterium]